jgi:hypothetical protein
VRLQTQRCFDWRFLVLLCLGFSVLGVLCCGERTVHTRTTVKLAPNIALRVGDVEISSNYLAAVQRAQALSVDSAQARIVDDVYAALRVAQSAPQAQIYARRTVLARTLLDAIRREAEQIGDASDQELLAATERYWRDVARPVMHRVTHVVVEVKDQCDSATARRTAAEIARRLPARVAESEFRKLVADTVTNACPPKVEDLEPVAADGRTLGETVYVPEFVKAAHELSVVGERSPVVETKFGFHVMLLTEVVPARLMQEEERRDWLQPEILRLRAKERLQAVLGNSRQTINPAVNHDALDAMGLLLSSKSAGSESN